MSLSPVVVLPAPPHPKSKNTAARYYAALLRGLAETGATTRALAIDDGSGAAAETWAAGVPAVSLTCYPPDPIRRDLTTRLTRLRRPMFDAAPEHLRAQLAVELADGYDVLHVEEFHLGPLTQSIPRSLLSVLHSEARDGRTATDIDARTRFRRARGVRAERVILSSQRHIRVLSRELEADVRAAGASAPVSVVPLSLELDGYEFRPSGRSEAVGLIGSMRWPPTRAAALRLLRGVWPQVIRHLPDAELVLAGWDAHSLAADAQQARGVTLLSDLDDHREFFDRIGLLAFPLDIGSGMKVKVLEAMAMGVGVVTTPTGTEGLTNAENAVWYGRSDDELATAIVSALRDPTERVSRARRAHDLIHCQCAPDVVAAQMTTLYTSVANWSRPDFNRSVGKLEAR